VVEVEVQEALSGPRLKRARFGFRDLKAYRPAPAVGQTGCFYGVEVGRNDFYVVPLDCFCGQTDPSFANNLAQTRRAGGLLARPEQGLKSRDAEDRLLTAHLLALRSIFAPFRFGETGRAEPIDAEQSKLALLALAEADWKKHGREAR